MAHRRFTRPLVLAFLATAVACGGSSTDAARSESGGASGSSVTETGGRGGVSGATGGSGGELTGSTGGESGTPVGSGGAPGGTGGVGTGGLRTGGALTSGGTGGECLAGYTNCNGACVSLGTDHNNCGQCGYACPSYLACTAGYCEGAAPSGGTGGDSTGGTGGDSTGGTGGNSTGGAGGNSTGGAGGTEDPLNWLCNGMACVPGASCNEAAGHCECGEGWDGDGSWCIPTAACPTNPCLNGGTCHASAQFEICTCPSGYGGVHCEVDCAGEIQVPDATLEAAIRGVALLSDGEPITAEAVADVYDLVVDGEVADLTGIECLTSLRYLRIPEAGLTDLTPLAALPRLTDLDVSCNPITSLEPLRNLANLTSLNVSQYSHCNFEGGVSDLTPVASLTGLTYLGLDGNEITSLEPLSGLTHLTRIVMASNPDLTSLSGIENAVRMEYMAFSYTQIASLEPLRNFTELTTIYASDTSISDLEPIAALPLMDFIFMPGAPIDCASPVVAELQARLSTFNSDCD